MNYFYKTICYCLLSLVATSISFSQEEKMGLEAYKDTYMKKYRELGFTKNIERYYYKEGINLNKYEALKALGLDLKDFDVQVRRLNYKENALISDVIVTGTIVKRTYNPNQDVYFHSDYEIKVEKVIKGENLPQIIHVKTISGPSGEMFINTSEDPELFIGEKVLLCLDYVSINEMTKVKERNGKQYTINVSKGDLIINEKLSSKSGYLYNIAKDRIGSDKEIIEIMSKITSINKL